MEPLEKRTVYLNKEATKTTRGGGIPRAVSAVLTDDTVSTLATVVTGMQKNMVVLTNMDMAAQKSIAEMKSYFEGGEEDSSSEESDLFDENHDANGNRIRPKERKGGNRHNVALMRQGGKPRALKRVKKN